MKEISEISEGSGRGLITIMSDFGWSSQGVGIMKAWASSLCPHARVVDITHEIESFNIIDGASELETMYCLPRGGVHVCVVDPGVGTHRRILAIETGLGDFLVGPDNGVLIPAAKRLGGVKKVAAVENRTYMLGSLSSTFHGRDIMIPAAAAISNGVNIGELGPELSPNDLYPPAFEEAAWEAESLNAAVIHINKYGTLYLNVLNEEFEARGFTPGAEAVMTFGDKSVRAPVRSAFGDVNQGQPLLYAGHYGRAQAAINLGSFKDRYDIGLGDDCILKVREES